jgi:hypothetical protein
MVKEVQVPTALTEQPLSDVAQYYSFDLKTGALKKSTT